LRAGARGYVTKQEATPVILKAIRHVLTGELYVGEHLAQQLVGVLIRGKAGPGGESVLSQFTDRELEVFQLLSQWHSTSQIAELLKLSAKTVESHQAKLKEKCHLTTLDELRRYAITELQRQ